MSREDRVRIEQILEEILQAMLEEDQEFLAIPGTAKYNYGGKSA